MLVAYSMVGCFRHLPLPDEDFKQVMMSFLLGTLQFNLSYSIIKQTVEIRKIGPGSLCTQPLVAFRTHIFSSSSLFFFFFSMHDISPTLGAPRKLIFIIQPYCNPTRRSSIGMGQLNFFEVKIRLYEIARGILLCEL